MRLATLLGLVALLNLVGVSYSHAQAVIISEMADPRLNYVDDRFIEIYNAGGTSVDLTGWTLVAVGNGGDIFTWNLSGSIAPGQALVAGDLNPFTPFTVNFPAAAWSTSNSTWNGKVGDGARLVNNSAATVDYAVVDGTHFENMDYVRNSNVVTGSLTYNQAQWTATAIDYPTEGSPGTHTAGAALPVIGAMATVPAAPVAGETVHVTADVTAPGSTLTGVEVHWGTSASPLPNTIAMSVQSGDTWITNTPIPAQVGGTTVYYEVEATNAVPATTTSSVQDYFLATAVSIYDIQGQVANSPYVGSTVRTQGVVTGVYGNSYVIQDGTGLWSGLWVNGVSAPTLGDSVSVQGDVTESFGSGFDGTTFLANASVLGSGAGVLPPPAS